MNAQSVVLNLHKFPYKWNISDGYPAKNIDSHGLKVFGSFLCGGGSTMGYKLAGYTHIGGIEIDKSLASVYKVNHNPKYFYNEDIRDFNKRNDLPEDLFDLDIFDGSPPCSTFSTSGNREKDWGKEKVFREGQSKQTLDDLFFHWIDTVNKLRPKVAIAENVSGLIKGNAKGYVIEINKRLKEIGYNVQLFHLNAASMGVPQKRERVFFICSRQDLNFPKLKLEFNEKEIPFKEIEDKEDISEILKKNTRTYKGWLIAKIGANFRDSIADNGSMFGYAKIGLNIVVRSIVSNNGTCEFHPKIFRKLNKNEIILAGSFPIDYNFMKQHFKYLIGMSVPPVMMAQISHQIYLQWFKK